MTPYEFRVGEDISVALDAMSGDPDSVSISAFMMLSNHATGFRRDPRFEAIALTVAQRSAAGRVPAGWNITLPAAQSAHLAPGLYGIDAVISGPGSTTAITARTALIRLTAAAVPVPAP